MTPQVALESLPRLREAFSYLSVLPPSSATDLLEAVLVSEPPHSPLSHSLSLFFTVSYPTATGPVQFLCERLSFAGAKEVPVLQVSLSSIHTHHLFSYLSCLYVSFRQVDVRKIAVGGYLLLLKKFTVSLITTH